ncbi:MAG: BREX-1 system adenine-specific DNA-methyltransferase PglX [Candidatus Methanoperedens sp.]
MDKASIIRFSDTVRDRLYEETKNRAANYGIFPDKIQDVDKEFEDSIVIGGRVFNRKIKRQREQLVREAREKGYDQLIDEVTYTWFNRFVALKFMEENGYLLGNVKVFSSNETGKTEPDILSKSLKLDFLNIDRNAVIDLKSAGKDEELYKFLTLSLCNYLNKIMPFLFESIEDHTELLFPDKLLHTDSILRDINGIIKEEDWKEVEVIGWIYQDYINPRKDKVFADLKKNIKISKENIPAATQLFTPKWIVKYLVENSLGRLWLESNPNKDLQAKFRYFIEQNTTTENTEGTEKDIQSSLIPKKRIVSPEDISVLDPAKGSGHILVYAFEVLYEIYRSQGYLESEIAPLILNKNLYGLEIDDRAAQLAGFALMMKARMYDKELFIKKISLNLCAIQETREECALNRGKYPELCRLWDFFIDAKNYGSILKVEGFDFERVRVEVELLKKEETLDSVFMWSKLEQLVRQARQMSQSYDCVITNPPYMGSGGMNAILADFVKNQYQYSKRDLFAVFIEKCLDFTKDRGFTSMITMQSWMFLSSYEKLRVKILKNHEIDTMVHLGPRAFEQIGGEVVSTTAFVLRK